VPTLLAVSAIVDACHPCRSARSAAVSDQYRRWRYETYGGRATSCMRIPAVTAGSQRCARMASALPRSHATTELLHGARRRPALLLRRRRGSRLGGIPSFSAAASETQSSAVSVESAATARLRFAVGFRGQLDHAGGLGWGLAARHPPQFRQIVVPLAGLVLDHRIEGVLPRPSAAQATCSVSLAQPEQ
jgi:hypothetical protein